MSELNLMPMNNNHSNFYSTISFKGSDFSTPVLFVDLISEGKLWFEISVDNNQWFYLNELQYTINKTDIIPINGLHPLIYYRVCTEVKVNTLKLIY